MDTTSCCAIFTPVTDENLSTHTIMISDETAVVMPS
jgi:hypothetical protein